MNPGYLKDWRYDCSCKTNSINNKGKNLGFSFFETSFAARNFCPWFCFTEYLWFLKNPECKEPNPLFAWFEALNCVRGRSEQRKAL